MKPKTTNEILNELDLLKDYMVNFIDHKVRMINLRRQHNFIYRYCGNTIVNRIETPKFPSFKHWRFSQHHNYQFPTFN